MIERQGMHGRDGILAFMRAYIEAPQDVEVSMHAGRDESGDDVLVISLEYPGIEPLTVGLELMEVAAMARLCDVTATKFRRAGYSPQAADLLTLANGLRDGLASYSSTRH